MIISKETNYNKKNTFDVTQEILPINTQEATKILSGINIMAKEGRKKCWPIPPESGLVYALSKKIKNKNERDLFQKKWEGDLYIKGERETLAMELCFGKECTSSTFLDDELFDHVLMSLYQPILEYINKSN